MKLNVTIDCTPEEARTFFGLPDVQPLQQAVLAELQDKVHGGFKAMEPAEFMRAMLTQYTGGLEQVQTFLSRIDRAAAKSKKA